MSLRGGARASWKGPRPSPSTGFRDALVSWCKRHDINDLHKYEHLRRPQAADGPSLAKLRGLIDVCLDFNKTMEWTYSAFKDALLAAVHQHPELNRSKFQIAHWASFRGERLITISSHFRRVAMDEVRNRQMCAKCTPEEIGILKEPRPNTSQ